jgi:hypothetical protein
MRKITTGTVGGPILGTLLSIDNSFRSNNNDNINLTPNGSGVTASTNDLQIDNNKGLKLSDSGSNYVTIKAPSSASGDYTLTFPADDGGANEVLTTDGNGVLSWTVSGLTVTDQIADSSTYYPTFIGSTSGTTAGVNVSSSKMTYQPSTGTLTATILSADSLTLTGTGLSGVPITGGSINNTPIGNTTRNTGQFTTMTATTIVEDSSIALKENINPISNALDIITKLNGVTYDRKDGSSKNEAGLIAETVNEILPNLVSKDSAGNPVGINYTKFSAYLIEALKELASEVNRLKSRGE